MKTTVFFIVNRNQMFFNKTSFVIILAFFCLTSCSNNDTYEDVSKEYIKNKDNLSNIVKVFDELPQYVLTIARKEDRFEKLVSCNIGRKSILYAIVTKKDNKFYDYRITIDKDNPMNEDSFWKQDYSLIKNKDGLNLNSFLEDYKISKSSFVKIVTFLLEKKYSSLNKENSTTVVSFTSNAGIVYSGKELDKIPVYGDPSLFKKIDNHCYYFYNTGFP